jgi:hypothetical protein
LETVEENQISPETRFGKEARSRGLKKPGLEKEIFASNQILIETRFLRRGAIAFFAATETGFGERDFR